jgi:hypothetical protein
MDYWFVNAGEIRADLSREYRGGNRSWDDCRRLGFISAGQDRKYSDQLRRLCAGAEVFAYLKGSGQNLLAEFRLSSLSEVDLNFIESLRKR